MRKKMLAALVIPLCLFSATAVAMQRLSCDPAPIVIEDGKLTLMFPRWMGDQAAYNLDSAGVVAINCYLDKCAPCNAPCGAAQWEITAGRLGFVPGRFSEEKARTFKIDRPSSSPFIAAGKVRYGDNADNHFTPFPPRELQAKRCYYFETTIIAYDRSSGKADDRCVAGGGCLDIVDGRLALQCSTFGYADTPACPNAPNSK